MLEELSVRNFALIDSLTLPLEAGFSVLTGETGAGKSIIVGSLSFLLGAKADTEVIRSGCDEAGVSAVVSVEDKNRDALEWLAAREIETDDSRLVIRRAVKSSGRSSIYIQNVPITRGDLAEFMGFLFDLHGQHNHESLLRKETHRLYLDRFAGLEDEAMAFHRVFVELAEKRKTLEASLTSERDREARLEILNYSVEEITKAAPKSGEIKELEAEAQRLGDFERLSEQVNSASLALYEDAPSLLSLARRSRTAVESAASIDASLSPLLKRIEDLYYEAEDLSSEFRQYAGALSYDPQRLEEAEERLSLLYKLKKKYRPQDAAAKQAEFFSDEDGILAYKAEAEAEIEALGATEENRDKLKAAISALEKDLASKAQALSVKRNEGAKRLGSGITGILSNLGMPNAVFSAQVQGKAASKEAQAGRSSANLVCGPWGADDVEFMISANKGEPLKELARIASGGELSRVMLAIKTILCGSPGRDAASADAQTLVFDEIDTGIGGEVALSVGEYLSQIGKGKQIFCVTHLASIAVRADNHLRVEKKVIQDGGSERTVTGVSQLSSSERRQEIARMLAGESGTAALAHADELLAKYGMNR
ncbi:MAG: DNA repair protein RecN [Treponema sp.]|nr:DNA repair protein RecN [Treponema sp.]